jgi:hypothetical protein
MQEERFESIAQMGLAGLKNLTAKNFREVLKLSGW